jgi:hypothetical protein
MRNVIEFFDSHGKEKKESKVGRQAQGLMIGWDIQKELEVKSSDRLGDMVDMEKNIEAEDRCTVDL